MKVTIPEGVTLKKTAGILEDAGICEAEEFLAAASSREILDTYRVPGSSMEGYLYPDTYLFPLAYPASRVVRVMADTFFERLNRIIATESPGTGSNYGLLDSAEINKRVVIASIVSVTSLVRMVLSNSGPPKLRIRYPPKANARV